ncbi:MAG: 8-amino-7-oxononanoate synthase [bacterium]
MIFLKQELDKLVSLNLYRALKTITDLKFPYATINGKKVTIFCSNNYLGLADHPKVLESFMKAAHEFGVGSTASRLISGNTTLHEELEDKIAKLKRTDSALLFPTGYMANLGAISALVGKDDIVFSDRLNHASIYDGIKLSGAKLVPYPHKDMKNLEKLLAKYPDKKKLVVTDSVFSMDGDIAPLPELISLSRKYNAIFMIDEAHATGVLGDNGSGAVEHFGLKDKPDIIMGTLSKALGVLGGFVAGSKELIDYLKNRSRSFIYTTAMPAPLCAAAIESINISQQQSELRKKLMSNIAYFKAGSKLKDGTHIIPIIIGDNKKTLKISQSLFEDGLFVSAIRPPTVPDGTSRLRITLSSKHSKADIDRLLSSLRGTK